MSKYSIEESTLKGIANAVREMCYDDDLMTPAEIEEKIRATKPSLPMDVYVQPDNVDPITGKWVRPQEWPDLDSIAITPDFDGVYLSYDLNKTSGYSWIGVCAELINNKGTYHVERGHLAEGEFVVDEAHEMAHNVVFRQNLDETYGAIQLWRIWSDDGIKVFTFRSKEDQTSVASKMQPVVEATGQWLHLNKIINDSLDARKNYYAYITVWLERDSRAIRSDQQITSLSSCFYQAYNLVSLDMSKWNTGNWTITSLASCFSNCASLRELDLRSWDTSNWAVTNLSNCFYNCWALRVLDLRGLDTLNWKVTTLSSCFAYCRSLQRIYADGLDTSKWVVTNLSACFNSCYSLKKLDLRGLDTLNWKVTTLSSCFAYCNSLQRIDLRGLDTSNWEVIDFSSCFQECVSLTNIFTDGLDTRNWAVKNLNNCFSNCYKIVALDFLNDWDTSNWEVTTFSSCFNNCKSLEKLNLENWDTSNWAVTNVSSLFSTCHSLKELNISSWDTSNWAVDNMRSMFDSCRSLKAIDLRNWDAHGWRLVGNGLGYTFSSLDFIESIYLPENLDLAPLTSATLPTGVGLVNYGGAGVGFSHGYSSSLLLSRESLLNIFSKLPVVSNSPKLTLGNANYYKLTPEEIAVATTKGWNVVA